MEDAVPRKSLFIPIINSWESNSADPRFEIPSREEGSLGIDKDASAPEIGEYQLQGTGYCNETGDITREVFLQTLPRL